MLFVNVKSNSLIVFGMKCFAYDIFCTLGDKARDYLNSINIPNQLISAEANDEIAEIIITAVVLMCNYVEENLASASVLEKNVMNYIQDNYDDFDLGLQKIADHLNMHPAYLSSSFKERCGEGISERITKVRLSKSLSLLDKGFSISETAKKVGYINVRTFSAAFRRYYGKNPSSIRKN